MRVTMYQLKRIIREACVSGEMGDWHGETPGRALGDGGSAAMARGQLFVAAQKAQSLYDRLSDDDEIPEWVQSKINTVDDYMSTIEDYLGYKMHRHDSGDPLPAHESRRRVIRTLREAEDENTTGGQEEPKKKTPASVAKAGAILDKMKPLTTALTGIDTSAELEGLLKDFIENTGDATKGKLTDEIVAKALKNVLASLA
jgi:hypothetical protein